MRKTVIYIAMSLDGYIADKNGEVNWLVGDNSDTDNVGSYDDFITTVDTVIMGYNTYNQIIRELSPNIWPYEGKECYVLTHKTHDNKHNISFINSDIKALLTQLKKENKKNIWICGGASVVNQVIKAQLADEITVSVIPVLLGDGIRLFETINSSVKLQLLSTKAYNGIVDLTYKPIH